MSERMRLGARFSAALVVVAVPVSMTGLTPSIVPVAHTAAVPRGAASAHVSTAPIAPSVTRLQRHYLSHLPVGMRPQVVAEQTTIAAGLSLSTKAERNRRIALTSAKGSHVWTASALAEHDLPSAAMRAYKNAARSIDATDPGCHIPWTLLAGIGRVESDHGRYGGSVLGNDGVPRPAIVGVALNGKGPVAAIQDTDGGAFDGDTVWDRAVGPMQFIPSTWQGAGRDGDRDGVRSPNDIDDASLAAAAYLCGAGGDLSDDTAEKAAVFRYNPSDYYVALVTAFARGYRTGVFVIPSPDVAPGAGDGVVHLKADHQAKAHAAKAKARAARLARIRAARLAKARARAAAQAAATETVTRTVTKRRTTTSTRTSTSTGTKTTTTTTKPSPSPSPSPTPAPLVLTAVTGAFAGSGSEWTVNGHLLDLGPAQMGALAARDYDKQNGKQTLGEELAGLAGTSVTVKVKDGTWIVYLIAGEDYRGADGSLIS
jgi:membrane-bound lytic murein transglycosylase B